MANYRLTVLTSFLEVEDSLAALSLLSQEEALQNDAVAASDKALTLARNRYQGGITTYLEVVTAQSTALTNARVAVAIQTRRKTASVDLVRALGGGWKASDLPSGSTVLSHADITPSPSPAPTPTPAPSTRPPS